MPFLCQPQSAAEAVYQPLHPVLPPQHYGHAPWHYGHPSHAPPMHMQPVYDPSLAPVAPLGSYGVPPAAGMQVGVLVGSKMVYFLAPVFSCHTPRSLAWCHLVALCLSVSPSTPAGTMFAVMQRGGWVGCHLH
jgi:hypothetical protein